VTTGENSEVGTTISDSQGRFRFGITHGRKAASVMLQAMTADGYSTLAGPFRTDVVSDQIVLRIIRSGRLEGDVVDQNGRPVKWITIAAMPQSAEAVIPLHNLAINSGRSINNPLLEDNNFVYARLHPGKYTLEVHCPWTSDTAMATTIAMVEAGKTTNAHLVVDMSEFGEVAGVVLADGKPVVGQVINVGYESGSSPVPEWTGPDGSYSICNLLPGRVHVTATPQYGTSGRQLEQTAEVVSGEVTTVNFDLSGSGEAKGSVEGYVMAGGRLVYYCSVTLKSAEAGADNGAYTANVDYQGRYKIEQIPAGDYVAQASFGDAV
jgi:hypothetical protein